MALINCPECNKEISDKAKVCPNCGYDLPVSAQDSPKRPPIKCPGCGESHWSKPRRKSFSLLDWIGSSIWFFLGAVIVMRISKYFFGGDFEWYWVIVGTIVGTLVGLSLKLLDVRETIERTCLNCGKVVRMDNSEKIPPESQDTSPLS